MALLSGSQALSAAASPRSASQPPAPQDATQLPPDGVAGPPGLVTLPLPPQPQTGAPGTVQPVAFEMGIPTTVLAAYRRAEEIMRGRAPNCHLPWSLLAGIGKIESDHANNRDVDANGHARHPAQLFGP